MNENGRNSVNHARSTWRSCRSSIRADIQANAGDPKSIALLSLFRLTQMAMGNLGHPRKISYPLVMLYRIVSELLFGVELRPKTRVGDGLTIFHGYGLVVNNSAVIGRNVTLRNGVTIGSRRNGGACPVLEDGVEVGAGAVILGGIVIGSGSKIGAGSVVLNSVPSGSVAVGNPARLIK
ncbi:serine O-acetyltransferase [Rhodococcus ruber]|uniref:serine O-acetyltransferase n=1 Tax=Rhodococcus ruber TaxID=1830 RepID=UPI000F53B4F3|nr:hypothetical protein TN91_21815 [Rhodococcus ruber]